MLKIRLQRVGKKHEPVFRIVVCDSKSGPKAGNNIETLGSYDPRDKNQATFKEERIKHWISVGAQVSDTVHNLLLSKGIIKGEKVNALPKKTPIVKELTEEEKAAAEKAKEAPAEEAPTEEAPAEEVPTEEAPEEEAPTETSEKEESEEVKEEEKIEAPVESTTEEK